MVKHGPFESLAVGKVERPIPKDKEVLVRVHAATLNRTDFLIVMGWLFAMRFFTGLFGPKRPVPGMDFAGVIDATGKEVVDFQVGQKVWGFLAKAALVNVSIYWKKEGQTCHQN